MHLSEQYKIHDHAILHVRSEDRYESSESISTVGKSVEKKEASKTM